MARRKKSLQRKEFILSKIEIIGYGGDDFSFEELRKSINHAQDPRLVDFADNFNNNYNHDPAMIKGAGPYNFVEIANIARVGKKPLTRMRLFFKTRERKPAFPLLKLYEFVASFAKNQANIRDTLSNIKTALTSFV